MKRIVVALALLVIVLSIALGLRIRSLEAYKKAPAGGSGTIEGVEVDITPRIGARIRAIHTKEGDDVQDGQLLVDLDCAEPDALVAEAKARLASAQSTVRSTRAAAQAAVGNTSAARYSAEAAAAQAQALAADRSNLEREAMRLSSLYSSGSISDSQLDQVDTRVVGTHNQLQALLANEKAARARADSAQRSQLAASAQTDISLGSVALAEASLRRAEIAVQECRLLAPRTGVVLSQHFEPGEVVLPGSRVLTIVDLSTVKSTFYLPNAELAVAAPGRPVLVHADAYPTETFQGSILRISPKAEFTPRNVQTREDRDRLVYGVEISIPNPAKKLRPGMPVEVVLEGTNR